MIENESDWRKEHLKKRKFYLMRLNKTALSIWMVVFVLSFTAGAFADDFSNLPVKGMATMIDLGAKKCIPCKMMAPIMEKMEKAYKGKAHIIFIDVWENRDQAKRFNLRAIPTQIFFNEQGEEVYRHVGFLDENSIVEQLTKMGVAAPELINKG